MWSKFKKLEANHQILFTIIVGVAVIIFWRGIWWFSDYAVNRFLPGHEIIGYLLLIVTSIAILLGSGYLINMISKF